MAEPVPVFLGDITAGTLRPRDLKRFKEYLFGLGNIAVEIVIRKARRRRTLPENSYFHAVVVKILADEFGWDFYDMKDFLKGLFFVEEKTYTLRHPVSKKSWTGKVRIIRHTSETDTIAFEDRMQRIREWALKQGVKIPLPNEVDVEDIDLPLT